MMNVLKMKDLKKRALDSKDNKFDDIKNCFNMLLTLTCVEHGCQTVASTYAFDW